MLRTLFEQIDSPLSVNIIKLCRNQNHPSSLAASRMMTAGSTLSKPNRAKFWTTPLHPNRRKPKSKSFWPNVVRLARKVGRLTAKLGRCFAQFAPRLPRLSQTKSTPNAPWNTNWHKLCFYWRSPLLLPPYTQHLNNQNVPSRSLAQVVYN